MYNYWIYNILVFIFLVISLLGCGMGGYFGIKEI